jgi:hypothetical protein
MRAVAMHFAGAADGQKWTVDADCVAVSCISSVVSGVCVVSFDPARTIASLTAGPTGLVRNDIIAVNRSYIVPTSFQENTQAGTQLRSGESVFFSSSAASVILLYVDP